MNIYIGIDPGANGGIAALKDDGNVLLHKALPNSNYSRWSLIYSLRPDNIRQPICYIERITTAAYGTGKSSWSKLYGSYCALQAWLVAACIDYEPVSVKSWQSALGMTKRRHEIQSHWKKRLLKRAEYIFPRINPTEATADALLIAYYCWLNHKGKL